MVDLSTTYLGLKLKSPLVHSASPLSRQLDSIRRLEDAGASAVVMHSLFEEELEREGMALHEQMTYAGYHYAEALTYYPDMEMYGARPDHYLELLRSAKSACSIPILGSLNGVSTGGWIDYARQIQDAGADALELNIYFVVTDADRAGCEVEQMYLDLVQDLRSSITIPLAVKIGPYFTNFANMARRLDKLGVNALVLFNRFYQPEVDLESLSLRHNLDLSTSSELRLRLRWVGILHGRIQADLAVTGGVHDHEGVLKSMMVGAKVAMMTSALLQRGPGHLRTVEAAVRQWMEEHEYSSIQQMQGSMSQISVGDAAAYERANYMRVLRDYRLHAMH